LAIIWQNPRPWSTTTYCRTIKVLYKNKNKTAEITIEDVNEIGTDIQNVNETVALYK